jgi:hypothetical protein
VIVPSDALAAFGAVHHLRTAFGREAIAIGMPIRNPAATRGHIRRLLGADVYDATSIDDLDRFTDRWLELG